MIEARTLLSDRRPLLTWLTLLLLTGLSWTIGEYLGGGFTRGSTGVLVMGIGFAKARWVGLDFMELRRAPRALRLPFELWIAGTFVVLATLLILTK